MQTSSTLGPFHTVFSVCRAHGDVTHGGSRDFVSSSYSFPQNCMPYRLSVGVRFPCIDIIDVLNVLAVQKEGEYT